ncbi:MAG: hypothetical protein ACI8O8_001513, partial [Oleiphilaceae bacterium]
PCLRKFCFSLALYLLFLLQALKFYSLHKETSLVQIQGLKIIGSFSLSHSCKMPLSNLAFCSY